MTARVVARKDFWVLLQALDDAGYSVIGPRVSNGAIVYGELSAVEDFPIGWTEVQDAGTYRLEQTAEPTLFGYALGPQSWKRFLFPPRSALWNGIHEKGVMRFEPVDQPEVRRAFIGVRSCELAAMGIQDKVFLESGFVDAAYAARRSDLFLVAVNCAVAGGTCFCVSMDTGPRCDSGYDLVITEVYTDTTHDFVIEVGSELGAGVLAKVPGRPATADDLALVDDIVAATSSSMGRTLEADGLQERLAAATSSDRWIEVAERCLGCANCTLVCPTCFCSTYEESPTLDAGRSTRVRRWDSCFTMDFTSLHGHPVRPSLPSRYRQWLTHKFGTWHDQFGSSGCVGCGRCITWCPVGIDVTAELTAIRREQEVTA